MYFIYTCAGGKCCQTRYFTTLVSQTQLLHRQLLLFLLTVYSDFSVITRSTGTLNTATAAVFAEQQVHSGRDENMHYGLANAIDCSRQCQSHPDCCCRRRGLGMVYARCTIAVSAGSYVQAHVDLVSSVFVVDCREAAAQTSHQCLGDGGISVSGTVWASR